MCRRHCLSPLYYGLCPLSLAEIARRPCSAGAARALHRRLRPRKLPRTLSVTLVLQTLPARSSQTLSVGLVFPTLPSLFIAETVRGIHHRHGYRLVFRMLPALSIAGAARAIYRYMSWYNGRHSPREYIFLRGSLLTLPAQSLSAPCLSLLSTGTVRAVLHRS